MKRKKQYLMSSDDYNAIQHLALPGDDNLARITVLQAQKCAAIIQAYRSDTSSWCDYIDLVTQFLQAAAIAEVSSEDALRKKPAELWGKIKYLPWPLKNNS